MYVDHNNREWHLSQNGDVYNLVHYHDHLYQVLTFSSIEEAYNTMKNKLHCKKILEFIKSGKIYKKYVSF